MKVLFAVNNDKIAESIIRKYQEEYREIISSKTVYYFNAIIKELQKDKSYDRIVISEDLEMFANDNYQAIDKFIFEKMDAISDEATNSEGNDIPIILLCTDRRTKNDPILVKLFGLGIYGVLIGQDRSIPKVCNLIYKPRSKKEAKQYYKVESGNINYSTEQNESSVSETEIQNIVYHYKKIGNNVAKCVQSFDSIYNQYSEEQIKLIIQVLPTSSKIILEENSEKYREVMGIKSNSNKSHNSSQGKEYVETKINSGNKLTKPVIIPTSVNVQKVNKVKNSSQELQEKQERLRAESKRLEEARKARMLEKKKEEERIAREKAKAEAEAKRKEEERIARAKAKAEAEAEAKRKEEERIAREKAKAEAEAKRKEEERIAREKAKAEAEAKRKEEERIAREKAKAEAEAKRKEEERLAREKAKAEAEAKRKEEERIARAKAKAEAEAKRKEEERLAREKAEAKKKEEDRMAKEKERAASTAKKKIEEKVTKNKTTSIAKTQKTKNAETTAEQKRGRGRPRKNLEPIAVATTTAIIADDVEKKKRGRPRKEEVKDSVKEVENTAKEVEKKTTKSANKPKKDTKKEELLILEDEKENLKNNKIIDDTDEFEGFDDFEDFEDDELDILENETKSENDEIIKNDIDDDFEDDDLDLFDDEDEDEEDIEIETDSEEEDIEEDDDFEDDDLDLFDDEDEEDEDIEPEIDSEDEEDIEEDDDFEDDDLDLFDDEDEEDEDIETETDSDEEEDIEEDEDFEDDDLDLFDDEDEEDIEIETDSEEEDIEEDDDFEDDDLDLFDDEDDDTETDLNSDEEDDDELDLFDEDDEDEDLDLFNEDEDDEEENEAETYSDEYVEDDETSLPMFEDDEDIRDNLNDEPIIVPSPNGNFEGISNKNYKYDSNLADSIKDLEETPDSDVKNSYNADIDNLITSGQKVVAFVGTSKNGTSFLVNNIADVFANKGIKTAILDLTKNKNDFYTYTNNEEALRVKAYECLEKLRSGNADGIKVNENLSVYTCLPGEDDSLDDVTGIIQTLINNYSIVLLDCDFSTSEKYFRVAQEIYLVQSLDVLTIQPLTAFLRDQKVKGILNPNKLRIVINKNIKVSTITEKLLIEGMSSYNDPGMTYMTELFDKNTIKYTIIPFDNEVYIKYLEGLVNCKISTKKYPKNFLASLNKLCDMVYPNVGNSKEKKYNEYDKKAKKNKKMEMQ